MARKQSSDRKKHHQPHNFPPMAALQHLSSSAVLPPPPSHSRFHFSRRQFLPSASSAASREPLPPPNCAVTRRQLIGGLHAAAAISLSPLGYKALADDQLSAWERVYLPIDPGVVLLDIAFVPDDPSHGDDLFVYLYCVLLIG